MEPYLLNDDAVMDIDGIWTFLLEREGLETADRIVDELFRSFSALAEVPGKGHRRADLTERDVRFQGFIRN